MKLADKTPEEFREFLLQECEDGSITEDQIEEIIEHSERGEDRAATVTLAVFGVLGKNLIFKND
jgi:hypothetical protein